ncbi:MAG: hypothetical protein U5K27_04725 [Desulfotignum sp.]|nr:hypothetical protein [Desulfotignum sp.]
MHFELPKGNVTYSVDQIKDNNTITARVIVDYGADLLSKKTYEFDINSNVKASGKQVRLAWKILEPKGRERI